MFRYRFLAITKERKKVKGILEVSNVEELRQIISYHNLLLLKYKKFKVKKKKLIESKLSKKELISFFRNMAMQLENNTNILNVFDIIKDISKSNALKKYLSEAKDEIQRGNSISYTMRKNSKLFPKLAIDLVELAEKTNSLKKTFKYLENYYFEMEKIKNKSFTAFLYPSLLLILGSMVFTILMFFIVPVYENIFITNGITIPFYTKLIFLISSIIRKNLYYLIISLLVTILVIFLFLISKKGKVLLEWIIRHMPIVKRIYAKFYYYQLSLKFSIALNSGISFIKCLDLIISDINNGYDKRKMLWIKEEIKRGQSISYSFETSNHFPKFYIESIKNGEKSNLMVNQFEYLSKIYLDELINTLNKVNVFIEPLSIIIISLFVGFIMFSIFIPMMSLFNNFI